MNITYKMDLAKINPLKIIELHQQGVITLGEIVASGEQYRAFNDDLLNYVNSQQKIAEKRMEQTIIMDTVSYGGAGRK